MTFSLHRFLIQQRWRLARQTALAIGLLRSLGSRGLGGTVQAIRKRLQPTAGATHGLPAIAKSPRANGKLLLFIDAAAPTPSRDSGSVRAHRILQLCSEQGWSLAFMPDNGQLPAESTHLLAELHAELIGAPGYPQLDRWLQHNGHNVQAVFLCRHSVARRHLQLLRAFTTAKIIFDTVDLHHVRLLRAAELHNNVVLHKKAARARSEEFELMNRSDATIVVSHSELAYLRQTGITAPILVLSNVHDVAATERQFDATADLLFVGGYQHHPNQEAVAWLREEIMPALRRRLPGIVLHLVGDMPEQDAARLRSDDIVVHGHVPSIEPFLQRSRINLAPLRSGAGVKGKINQAMSHGLPVVATSIAAEGMFLQHGENALIADSAEDFAAQVVRLYQDAALWQKLSRNGYQNIEEHFSSNLAHRTLEELLPPA
ncbi:glycosyltransferase [Stenotrophomonas sp. Iso1]|uniref:glycosyltransferase n=1 Tax=Stenotrophomonas sp. Iso1 TaxID=2977283 RepID=UPI0022B7A9DE|nr:glycosyltransferase [Stenotrophomonas sp. Iso1]